MTNKQEEEKKWTSIVRNFTQETTFHGVKYIAADTRFKSRRISWIIIVLGVLFTFTYALVTSILHYYKYPSNIELEVGYLDEVPFPSIAICNENPYRLTTSHEAGLYDVITQTYDRIQHRAYSETTEEDYYVINQAACDLPSSGAVFELELGDTSITVCKDLCSGYKTKYCSGFLYEVNKNKCTLTSHTGNEDVMYTAAQVIELQNKCAERNIYFYRRIRSIDNDPIYCNFEERFWGSCRFFDDTLRAKLWFILQTDDRDITFGSDKGHYLFVHDMTELLESSAEIHTNYINTTAKCLFAFTKILGTGGLSLRVSAISETLSYRTVAYLNNSDIDPDQQNVWRRLFKHLPDGIHQIAIEAFFDPESDGEFFLDDVTIDSCQLMTKSDSCIKSAVGSEYMGDLSTNTRGETCAIWKEYISYHNLSLPLDAHVPDASWDDALNYCRFVHGISTTSPGCFNEDAEYVNCEINRCPCEEHQFRCETSGVCIPEETTCDYESICEDQSDEQKICDSKNSVSCTFNDPFICGYKQLNNADQLLWLPEFDTSDLSYYLQLQTQGYVIPGLSVRLQSPITRIDSNAELSISFNRLSSSTANNALSVWFKCTLGHSTVPVIYHDHTSHLTDDTEEDALFEKELDGEWVQYKTCLPGTENTHMMIVIEAVYNSNDEDGFQIGEILFNSSNCSLPEGYQDIVIPLTDYADCSFDDDLCSLKQYSDHINLTWTLLSKDIVAGAMHLFNETTFVDMDCDSCMTYGDEKYDFIYFENAGTIQSTNYPDSYYPNFAINKWLIKGLYGVKIYIEFLFIGIEEHSSCEYDVLVVRDLSTDDRKSYCGVQLPTPYTSQGPLVEITFTSDYIINGPGFQLQYSLIMEKHIDNVAVLSYTSPSYTESMLYAYFSLPLTLEITGQERCLTFEYINLGIFTVVMNQKLNPPIHVFNGSDINFPQWKKVYWDYNNEGNTYTILEFKTETNGVLGRQFVLALNDIELADMPCSELQQKEAGDVGIACDFEYPQLCGYTQSHDYQSRWLSSYAYSELVGNESLGKVLKLVDIAPSIERERYWIASQVSTLAYNQTVSISLQELQYPNQNAIWMWLTGSEGHSSGPVAIYGESKGSQTENFPLLLNVSDNAMYKQYDLCLPAGDIVLMFEAVFETLDEFVISNVTLTGESCDLNNENIVSVFPDYESTTCNDDLSVVCPYNGLSSHTDLTWLNIDEDDVVKALSVNYVESRYASQYKADYEDFGLYDDVYVALSGVIRSPVYSSVEQTQFYWVVQTPADTTIAVTFIHCHLNPCKEPPCDYQISIKESRSKELMYGACWDYYSDANDVHIVYQRNDPGDPQYGFVLQYKAVDEKFNEVTGSAWILHYGGQRTSRPYKARLVTPLIHTTRQHCLSFAYISQTRLTVSLLYGNGSHSEVLSYTEVPSPLLWSQFTRTISGERGEMFYIEFSGEKAESFSKRYYLAVGSIDITNSSCVDAETESSDDMSCSFDNPDWCGYRELETRENVGWVSKYKDETYTDVCLGLSSKGHQKVFGMISYLWSPPLEFPHNIMVTITVKDTENLLSLWLHGSYGLSHTSIENSEDVIMLLGKSSTVYFVCVPGGENVTQQIILGAQYTSEKDIMIEDVDVTGEPCKLIGGSLFEKYMENCTSTSEICSYRLLPDNKHFTWTSIPKESAEEARNVVMEDGKLQYDGESYTDIFFTFTGELSLNSLEDLTLKWLIIMPEGVGVELSFDFISIGESGDPCEDTFLKITDGDEDNTEERCGYVTKVAYITAQSKVWISLEEYVEETESSFGDLFFEDSVFIVKAESDMRREPKPDGFELSYNPNKDTSDMEEILAVLYKGEPSEYDQNVRMISPAFVADTDHCLTFSYQSYYELSVALLSENGMEMNIFDDRSRTSSFWREAIINIIDPGNESMSLVFKVTKQPDTDSVYFAFMNSIVLYPQSCDLIDFQDSSVNCSFDENSCGYIDVSGNPLSKWLRDLSDQTITGSSDFVTHFLSHNMTRESSHFLSPVFNISEDRCLRFRVFQIHKTCLIVTLYHLDTNGTDTVVMECSYKQIGSWTDMAVTVPMNVSRFSLSVTPNKGLIQELYIDDITLHPKLHPQDTATGYKTQDIENSDMSDKVDITTTYITEDQMYSVLMESLDMSWHSVLEDVSHGINDSLLSCYWDGNECEDYMVNETVTDMGICITFNTHHKTLSSERSGSQHGLKLTLNTETYEHIAGIGTDSGFKIQFYDHHEIPIMERKGQVVSPGIHAMFTLNYAESKFLEPEYGTCGSVDLSEYPGLNYTTAHCMTQCDTHSTEKSCHCRLPYMPGSSDAETQCSVQSYLQCVLMLSQNSSQATEKCTCPDSCDKVLFEGQMSYSALSGLAIHTIIGNKEPQVLNGYEKAMEMEQRLDKDVFSALLIDLTNVIEIIESLELFVQVRIEVLKNLLASGFERITAIVENDVIMSTSEIVVANEIYQEYIEKERMNAVHTYQELPDTIWQFVHYVKWNHYLEGLNDKRELETKLDQLIKEVNDTQTQFESYIFLYGARLNETSCEHQASDLSKFPYCPETLHQGVSDTYFPLKAVLNKDLSDVCKRIADKLNVEFSVFLEDYPPNFYGTGKNLYTITFPDSYEHFAEVMNTSIIYADSMTELLDNLTKCLTEYGSFMEDTMAWRDTALIKKTWNTEADFSSVSDLQAIKLLMQRLHDSYAAAEITKAELSQTLVNGNGYNSKTSPGFIENWINAFSDQVDQYVTDMRDEFDELSEEYETVYTKIVQMYMNFIEYLGTGTDDTNIRSLLIFRNPRPQVLSSQVKYLYTEAQVDGLTSGEIFNFLNKSSLTHLRDNLNGYIEHLNYLLVEYKSEKDSVTDSLLTAMTSLQDTSQQYLDSIKLQPAFVQENILQVDVYYAELKYSRTEQKVAYGVGDFFSDLGGFLGLLLGASIITVFEVLDLIICNIIESRAFKNKVEPEQNGKKHEDRRKSKKAQPTVVVPFTEN